MNNIALRSGDSLISLDVTSVKIDRSVQELWTDGTFDGTEIPKVIGYVYGKKEGELTLSDGTKIIFSNYERNEDGSVVINPPYRTIEA